MTMRERIASFLFKAPLVPITRITGSRHVAPDRRGFQNNVSDGYMRNQVVIACVATRAQTLNEPPLHVVDQDGKPVVEHPLTRLFRRPNPYMPQSMFWQFVSTYIDIGGNCYIHKVRNVYGQVIELYPYHDGQVTPVASGQWVDHYKFEAEGITKEIPVDDIIHLRSYYVDPLNPIKALSPIRLCGINVDNYNELMETLYSYLRNNGVPSGVLSTNNTLLSNQLEALRSQFDEQVGRDKRGKPLILEGGMTYAPMGLNLTNLEVGSQFEQYETAVCGIFRVHPAVAMTVAGLRSSTYSNMQTAFAEYTTLTRIPTWNAWEETIEHSFNAEYPMVNVEFDTSTVAALATDPDAVIYPVIAQFNANIITLNEARSRTGYEVMEGMDKFAYELVPASGGFGFASAGMKSGLPHEGQIDQTNDIKAADYWKQIDGLIIEAQDELTPIVAETVEAAQRLALSTFAKSYDGKAFGQAQVAQLVKRFMVSSKPWRESLTRKLMTVAIQAVDGDAGLVTSLFDRITKKVTEDINAKITESIGTIRTEVQELVAANAGRSSEEIRDALVSKFDTLKVSRAEAIARTTARGTATTTTTNTWSALNEDETDKDNEIVKVWTTKRDGKVRESHRKMDGRWVTMDGTFKLEGGDESEGPGLAESPGNAVNCRCVLRPVRRKNLR